MAKDGCTGGDGMYLTLEQYQELTVKMLEEISAPGFKASGFDDTTIGDKSTVANIGFCVPDRFKDDPCLDMFPDPDLRSAVKYRDEGMRCPFDTRQGKESGGCFYHCLGFRGRPHIRNFDLRKAKKMAAATIEYSRSDECRRAVERGRASLLDMRERNGFQNQSQCRCGQPPQEGKRDDDSIHE